MGYEQEQQHNEYYHIQPSYQVSGNIEPEFIIYHRFESTESIIAVEKSDETVVGLIKGGISLGKVLFILDYDHQSEEVKHQVLKQCEEIQDGLAYLIVLDKGPDHPSYTLFVLVKGKLF